MAKHGEANCDHVDPFVLCAASISMFSVHMLGVLEDWTRCVQLTRRYDNKSMEQDVPPWGGCTLGCMYLQAFVGCKEAWNMLNRSLCGYDMI